MKRRVVTAQRLGPLQPTLRIGLGLVPAPEHRVNLRAGAEQEEVEPRVAIAVGVAGLGEQELGGVDLVALAQDLDEDRERSGRDRADAVDREHLDRLACVGLGVVELTGAERDPGAEKERDAGEHRDADAPGDRESCSTITAASASRSHITNAVTGRWNHIDSDESSWGIVASDRAASEPTVVAGSLAKAPTIARTPSTIGGASSSGPTVARSSATCPATSGAESGPTSPTTIVAGQQRLVQDGIVAERGSQILEPGDRLVAGGRDRRGSSTGPPQA